MNLFKKNTENTAAPKKVARNKGSWKHGGYAIAITAILVAVVVAVNIFFELLSHRVNLDIDISLQGTNTLSAENVDFIKDIEAEVTITVCNPEEDFDNGNMSGMAYYYPSYYGANFKSFEDKNGDYFTQTLNLLKLYSVYSDKIELRFADPSDPSFADIVSEYEASAPKYGDILVEGWQIVDDVAVERHSVIKFEDIYYLTDDGGVEYGYPYLVSGSNLETKLTSAIYKATALDTQEALIIGPHCDTSVSAAYGEILELNNFDVKTTSGEAISEISEDVDLIIIGSPKADFTAAELDIIDEWLYNGGIRGKGLIFLPSYDSPATPTLDTFLEEWGVVYERELLYETDGSNHMAGDNYTFGFSANENNGVENDYDEIFNANQFMISGGNMPLFAAYETEGKRKTHALALSGAGDTVVATDVSNGGSDWKPDGSEELMQSIGILVTEDADYYDDPATEKADNIYCTSYVVAFSGYDFVSSYWTSQYTYNLEPVVAVAKMAAGGDDDGFTFTTKTITSAEMDGLVDAMGVIDQSEANMIKYVFQWALPLLLVAFGIFVFVRRARR